ncbi:MAG TPA: helix-hairpin-helix domain-containing protein [Flavobacteriales bacterium]|nr:helix-hairpin-helix domain-containing protein [Flavobacteriales bacterium]HRP81076.1 helix-hairpin-helix domain-containing protein [Flavobacteriales bacterium]HRQ84911.1 helix-hairpin-helix domain-containing protein [Flavobacteriales bacterium]
MARRRQQRNWREEFKDLFAMHRGERRGFTVLLGFCIIAAGWVTWEQWIRPPMLADKERIEVVWHSLQDTAHQRQPRHMAAREDIELFNFDPNGLPVEQWVMLGLSERQAGAIHRFEERGGRFRIKRDLARMRVVEPELFVQWEPFIQLPDSLPAQGGQRHARTRNWPTDTMAHRWEARAGNRPSSPVELNKADSAELVAVPGIGPSFARSILRYRERLGGFTNLDQLAEVPILRNKPDAVQELRAKLAVDAGLVRRIPLNSCTVEELGSHPYMGWKVAKALIAYRQQHGPFTRVEHITDCVLVTDSIRLRMTPYLIVGEE